MVKLEALAGNAVGDAAESRRCDQNHEVTGNSPPQASALSHVLLSLFGLLHGLNPGATVTSTLAIALEAGVLLAAVFVLTRWLWMAFGLHAAWNFTEGRVFGASVSGHDARGLLASHFMARHGPAWPGMARHGPAWLTGGEFGPEASFVAVAVCLAAGAAVLVIAHRRGRFLPRSWPAGAAGAVRRRTRRRASPGRCP